MITLVERDFEAFFKAPFHAYGAEAVYVSPMKSDLARFLSLKNPLFPTDDDFTYFAALKDGRSIGRITAHVHGASNEKFQTRQAYFGFFDCADDPEAAGALLTAAETWARQRGLESLTGNFNLNAMQQAGVVTNGFEHAPFTDQIWNPPHVPRLLEDLGYVRRFAMTTFARDLTGPAPQVLPDDQRSALLAEGFSFAPINRRTINDRLEDARHILNQSFKDNPMFVSVTQEEFMFQAKDMKWIMDPRISKVVHFEGAPVGAVIAIPDLNPLLKAVGSRFRPSLPLHYLKHRMRNDRAVVIFQGVLPAFQRRGVNPLMLSEMTRDMVAAGYRTVGGTWIADENTASLRQVEKSGAAPLHRLHLFSKDLSE